MLFLYATDGSPGSAAVAEFLACLPLGTDDRVLLLAVEPAGTDEERLFGHARRSLAGSAARLETEVRSGQPAEQILAAARERGADVVGLGAMGATGLAQFFLGSVAERVARHADVPVLIARPVRHSLRRALVAVDASEAALEVVRTAVAFPLPAECELRLLTVLPPREAGLGIAPMVWASLSGEIDTILKAATSAAEDRLRTVAQEARRGSRGVSAEILHGDPASCLIAAADKEEADLLVLGSRGEGGMDRYLLGGVSERAVRHGRCSVLVAR